MTDSTLAQDPRELFDIVLSDGTRTGRSKPRSAVHRDGDWHRSIHVWVAGTAADGVPFLLVQRRNAHKDTWPGRLDATVGGHYRTGETLAETLRETEEEIGIAVSLAELRPLGVRVCVNDREVGTRDHELQDVFLLQSDRPLTEYRPDPAELSELVQIPLAALLDLFCGDRIDIEALSLLAGTSETRSVHLTMDDFIPTIDRYFYKVAIAAQQLLNGARHVAI